MRSHDTYLHTLQGLACALSLTLFCSLVPVSARAHVTLRDDPPPEKKYIATPPAIRQGRSAVVTIRAEDKSALPGDLIIEEESLSDASINLDGAQSVLDGNRLVVRLKADVATPVGTVTLRLKRKDEKDEKKAIVGTIEFNIEELQPISKKPTPEGIKQVDVMWSILPDAVVQDNFGRNVRKNFYAIEVVVGNNSGYDVQLTGVGFRSKLGSNLVETDKNGKAVTDEHGNTVGKYFIPTSDHRLVRGTVEKERLYGRRALTFNLLGGAGTLVSGFLPFFRVANTKANFGTFSSLLNGQVKDGFNLAAPDLTVAQLGRLENQVMHDEIIVPNNRQMRTVVFLPKNMFIAGETGKKPTMPQIMEALGDIVLVGRQIEFFLNREIVIETNLRNTTQNDQTNPTQPASGFNPDTSRLNGGITPATPITGLKPTITRLVTANDTSSGSTLGGELLTITGANFTGASKVTFGDTVVSVSSSDISDDISIVIKTPQHDPGKVSVIVTTPAGNSLPVDFTYNAP